MGGYPGSNAGFFGEVGVPGAPLDPLIYVQRAGSAMYGPLLMQNDTPTQPREPATLVYLTTQLAQAEVTLRTYTDAEVLIVRQYVDAQNVIVLQDAKDYTDAAIAALPPIPPVTGFLPITGGVITGDLQVTGDTNVANLNASANINTSGMYFEQGRPLQTVYLQLSGGWISGNLGVYGDINVSNGQYLLNGVPVVGMSQTPWTQPIDTADYPLRAPAVLVIEVAGTPAIRITPGSGVECSTLFTAPEIRCYGPLLAGLVNTNVVYAGGNSLVIDPPTNSITFKTASNERMMIDNIGSVRIACDVPVPPVVGPIGNYIHLMVGGRDEAIGTLDLYGYASVTNPWCGILAFVNAVPNASPQKQVAAISAVATNIGGATNTGHMSLMVNTGSSLVERMRIEQTVVTVVGDLSLTGGRYLINGVPVSLDLAAAIQNLETRVGRLESA